MENQKSICIMCGNRQQNDCIAGRVDTFQGMTIIKCPDFYKSEQQEIIIINEDGMRGLIELYYPHDVEKLTGVRIKGFMQFLFDDVTDWIKGNWESYMDQAGD